MIILGVHPGYHEAAACLFDDYRMVAAVSLERLTRRKNRITVPDEVVVERTDGSRKVGVIIGEW